MTFFKRLMLILVFPILATAMEPISERQAIDTQKMSFDQFRAELVNLKNSDPEKKEINVIGSPQDARVRQMLRQAERMGFKAKLLDRDKIDDLVEQLNVSDIPIEHRSYFRAIKDWWHTKHVILTPEERAIGLRDARTVFINKIVIGTAVWFAVGVDPVIASVLVLSQAWVDYWWTLNSRTMNNVVSGKTIFDDPEEKANFLKEITLRTLVSFAFASFWRMISTLDGAYGSVHLLTTFQGIFEVTWNSLMKLPSNAFATKAHNALTPAAYQKLSTTVFFLSTLIATADLAGLTFGYSKTFTIDMLNHMQITIKDSNGILLLYWIGMIAYLNYGANHFKKMVDYLHTKVQFYQIQEDRAIDVIGSVYDKAKDAAPAPIVEVIEKTEDVLSDFHSTLLMQGSRNAYRPVDGFMCSQVLIH